MNRRQFLILVIVLVVLGGIGAALFWQDIAAYRASGARIGAQLLPDVKIGEVVRIRLRDATSQTTLVRKEDAWSVEERGNYAASVQEISQMLLKLTDLRVTQSETIGESLLPRVDLLEPARNAESGKPQEGVGTLVELADASGKTVAALVLGRIVKKMDPLNPLPAARDGVPAARYVRMVGVRDNVVVVSDPLSEVEARPGRWLAKNFFKADRIRTLNVAGAGAMQWRITRDEEWGQWKFAAGGGNLDPSAAVGAVNALGNIAFTDIVPDAKPEALDKPVTVTAETFDNLTYTLKISRQKEGEGSDYLLSFAVGGEPPRQRVPEKGEKPEDKERRDKDFAETLGRLDQRIAQERALAKWVYVIEAKALDPVLRERAQMIARPPEKPTGPR
ncbi:MAG: DUF4340 domain-containing protein [Burkholderiales bacterium]|nr:DUF4340 domain-containing protein [Burkholderiales bacterium]